MPWFAIVITTHVSGLPKGLEEPRGVFASLDDAREYLHGIEEEWAARGCQLHRDSIRINEYATRKHAEQADPADGFLRGETVEGHKPLKIHSA